MSDIVDLCKQYAKQEGDTSYGATFADAANEIERLRAALRAIAACDERDDMDVAMQIAREALGDVCIGCGAHDATHQTADGPMCSICLANTGGAW